MKPDKLTIHDLFQRERRYVVPLYQRAYVWTLADQWGPLWEDIERQADGCLANAAGSPRSHFLGAIVLNVSRIVGAGVARSEVIDGQQRLTTLQLFIAAPRDYALSVGSQYVARLRRLTVNEDEKHGSEGSFKVWPTNADREIFQLVMTAGSPEVLVKQLAGRPGQRRMIQAYRYFFDRVAEFCSTTAGDAELSEQRIFGLLQALRTVLQMVVIELEDQDDPQVIFETLNARGQPLLPSDLIRNYIFMQASGDPDCDADELYNEFWRPFDDQRVASPVNGEDRFWHVDERQGRLTRPRIDLFLFHYLVMQTERDITIGALFREFRDWRDAHPWPIEQLLGDMRQHSALFAGLIQPDGPSRAATLARRLKSLDTSTVYPFLLFILSLPAERLTTDDRDRLLSDVESWLVRRFVCQLTNKNYNRFFVTLLAKAKRAAPDENLADVVRAELSRSTDVTTVWPSDRRFRSGWLQKPVYAKSRPDRSVMLLSAIEARTRTKRNEAITLPPGLSVEHLLPQRGSLADYPMDNAGFALAGETPDRCRDRLLHTIGNLTLLTGELNASVSNGPFPRKVGKIVADSDLRLNAWLRSDPPASWTERSIVERGVGLFEVAREIWANPTTGDDAEINDEPAVERLSGTWTFTDQPTMQAKRSSLLAAMAAKLGSLFIAETVGKHRSADGRTHVAITISKRYPDRAGYPYWYAYQPDWDAFLSEASEAYLVLGCIDRAEGYAIPRSILQPLLIHLNTTVRADTGKLHWHLHLAERDDGVALLLPKIDDALPLAEFAMFEVQSEPGFLSQNEPPHVGAV